LSDSGRRPIAPRFAEVRLSADMPAPVTTTTRSSHTWSRRSPWGRLQAAGDVVGYPDLFAPL